ncbi:MAG: hypothetical protein EAX96_03455 [Candidatus Lokiarchaeota archaeon]|nr:hypothetical protein [Candidatus Lokiarchaeota archaeon]
MGDSLKILITYHSQTGNTEKIAKGMKEALKNEDVTLLPATESKPETFDTYDIVFLGSGVYGGIIGKSLRNLMHRVVNLPGKFVLFSTHSSISHETHIKAFSMIRKSLEESNCEIVAEYDCLGENREITPERRELFLQSLPKEKQKEALEHIEKLKGHPNIEDVENAKKFVFNLMKKLKN